MISYFLNSRPKRIRLPLPMLKFQPKVIWDSNPDCQINPDVCQISPKMLWIHYLVGVSHFYRFVKIGQ